ncbi:hypothetical protein [Amycolatopsis sp. NPDC051372]|uniref:hypothetical protein n=1 Tax=Amycolatopsis sp. NPDC051372 TaxID=3155669 RepID=UPI0034301845
MSYCRWSTDDFQCDLYIYEDARGGWTIHVAGNRVAYTQPLPEPIELTDTNFDEWWARHKLVGEMVDRADRVPIELPHAGEAFNELTAGAAADRVRELRNLGYHCPDRVEQSLREEAQEDGRG